MVYKAVLLMLFIVVTMHSTIAQTATICLTYDDGLPSHLSTVIPQLDSFGFKATFFLNSFQGSSTKIGEASPILTGWRKAANNGHELGNHTLFHPCPEKLGWAPEQAIESYSLERLLTEIATQQNLLNAFDTTRTQRAYAYPCNNTIVAGIDYSTILPQRTSFRIARTGGDSTSIIAKAASLDRMKVPSWLVEEGTTLEQLIRFAEKARASNGIAVYQFHGIGGEFFRLSEATHRAFLSYLNDHKAWYKVSTFSEAIDKFK